MLRVKALTPKQVRELKLPIIKNLDIKELRKWVGLSQAQLARMAGVPRSAIANIELDRYKLPAATGVDIFSALARATPPEFLRERQEIWGEAFRLLDFQMELDRKVIIEIKAEIGTLQKKLESREALAVSRQAKKAQLLAESSAGPE